MYQQAKEEISDDQMQKNISQNSTPVHDKKLSGNRILKNALKLIKNIYKNLQQVFYLKLKH